MSKIDSPGWIGIKVEVVAVVPVEESIFKNAVVEFAGIERMSVAILLGFAGIIWTSAVVAVYCPKAMTRLRVSKFVIDVSQQTGIQRAQAGPGASLVHSLEADAPVPGIVENFLPGDDMALVVVFLRIANFH